MTPSVTIAIPCFNAAQWLGAAIESALAQTAPACEVIVVDDGSTDGSVEVARGFGERVRLIAGEHRGGNAARNTALAAAQGEWLQFLDADDFLEPPKIAEQFSEARNGAEANVIYSPVWIDHDGTRTRSALDLRHDVYARWIAWELPQTGGALWRKDALVRAGGWKEGQPCCQEHELYARALMAGSRFVFAPTAHAVYRIWSEDTVCRRDPRQLVRVKTQLIDEMSDWLKASGRWTETHHRLAGRACFEMARTLAKYDAAEAATYHRERQTRGLMLPTGPAAPLRYRLIYHTLGFARAEQLAAAGPLNPMRIHGICLVKNEGDIVRHFLTRSAQWCDRIYVYDNGSTDGTWEIAQELTRTIPQIVLYRSEDKPFDDALRAEVFAHYRSDAERGDWWCRLDADELYIDEPRAFLAGVAPTHHVVWTAHLQYYFTTADLERFTVADETTPPAMHAENLPRYYIANGAEARFFRHRPGLAWTGGAWPRHLGLVEPRRIRVQHLQYRSPAQIQRRLDTRRVAAARGWQHFDHSLAQTWREVISKPDGLHLDRGDGAYEIDPAQLPNHLEPPAQRAIKRVMHGLGIWP